MHIKHRACSVVMPHGPAGIQVETVIAHIRHSLAHRFPFRGTGEMRSHFARRMAQVESYLNSDAFPARDGGGLAALAQDLHGRCAKVAELEGGRLRT